MWYNVHVKNINTSLFDFPALRDPQSDYVYVDKIAQLYEIAKPTADCIYYLPRPRRFGKSLMLSTLKAGNKAPVDFATTVNVKRLDAPDARDAPTVSLLYQGGYLTRVLN